MSRGGGGVEALSRAGLGALFLSGLSAVGDLIWARYIQDGAMVPGVIHGGLMFVALALVLGWNVGTGAALRSLLATLPATGLLVAAAFYPLAHLMGYLAALLVCWVAMWMAMAWAQRRARGGEGAFGRVLWRGGVAALGSGLAFWAVSGMWTGSWPANWGLGARLVAWTFAFFPGLAALFWRGRGTARDRLDGKDGA